MADTCTLTLYGLSTCIHCRRAIEFIKDNKVPCTIIFVDKLEGEERDRTIEKVRGYNPALSFPTMVVDGPDGQEVFVGMDDKATAEILKLAKQLY